MLGVVALAMLAPALAGASAPPRHDWMPDVEQRVADLRRRLQESNTEAEQRRVRSSTTDGWRRVAARPRPANGHAERTDPAAEGGR